MPRRAAAVAAALSTVAARCAGSTGGEWAQGPRAPPQRPVPIVLGLRNRNAAELERALLAVSDPRGPEYGRHWSLRRVAELTAPAPAALAAVRGWLRGGGVAWSETEGRDHVAFDAPAARVEAWFGVRLHEYTSPATGRRALHSPAPYELPAPLRAHVVLVSGLTDNLRRARALLFPPPPGGGGLSPQQVREWYGVDPGFRASSPANNWAVYASEGQYYSDANRKKFDKLYGEEYVEVAKVVGGPNKPERAGIEADGDTLYGMAFAKGVPTWFWYVDGGLAAWTRELSNTTDLPHVFSVSYADDNADQFPRDTVDFYDQQTQKAGLRGVSVFFASGDDGARGYRGSTKKWQPTFPADLPYVTSVGGTLPGPTPQKGASLSGGGFNDILPRPAYQDAAVAGYLREKNGSLPSEGGWEKHKGNRAFPDVASVCETFDITGHGPGVGTSNSAPAVAAFFALLNDVRLKKGEAPLGFVNPWLYGAALDAGALTDVTHGSNGFPAARGWDPVTGLGTLDWGKLVELVRGANATAGRA